MDSDIDQFIRWRRIWQQRFKQKFGREPSTMGEMDDFIEKYRTRFVDEDESKPYHRVLQIVSHGYEGLQWAINERDAKLLMDDYDLQLSKDMELAGGPMTSGNEGVKFVYRDKGGELTVMRIMKEWTGRWHIYKGIWKSDPRWTGD